MAKFFDRFLMKLIPSAADSEIDIDVSAARADAAEATVSGSAEVKNRCIAIMRSPEAAGRLALAQHIALATDLPIADALAALRACPRESVAATVPDSVAPAEAEKAATRARLNAAFSEAYRRADYGTFELAEKPETVVERMQANYARALGIPARKST